MSEKLGSGFQDDDTYTRTITAITRPADKKPGYYPPGVGDILTTHKGKVEVLGVVHEFEPLGRPHQVQLKVKLIRPGFGW